MARKRCCGLVEDEPICRKFIGVPPMGQRTINLKIEELEAVRLKDLVGLEQTEVIYLMSLKSS